MHEDVPLATSLTLDGYQYPKRLLNVQSWTKECSELRPGFLLFPHLTPSHTCYRNGKLHLTTSHRLSHLFSQDLARSLPLHLTLDKSIVLNEGHNVEHEKVTINSTSTDKRLLLLRLSQFPPQIGWPISKTALHYIYLYDPTTFRRPSGRAYWHALSTISPPGVKT